MPLSDEELIKSFRGGDKSALEELLKRYKNTVRSIAHKFFLSDWDREDIVQEGMCGLYSAIVNFSDGKEFFPYAFTCVKNRIIDAIKKSSAKSAENGDTIALDGEGAADGPSPEEVVIYGESVSEFSERIKGILSPLEYKTITMYIDGSPIVEISRALGITNKQVDNALSRAKKKLRALLVK